MLTAKLNSRRFYGLLIIVLLSTSLFTALLINCVSGNSDWLSGWSYRKSHVISYAAGAGTNYQTMVKVAFSASQPPSWFEVLPTNIPVFMTTDVASDGTVYAGDNNYNIYKSTDSGVTFTNIFTIPAQSNPWGVHAGKVWTVFVDSRGYLLVSAGSTNRLYRSTNGGASFAEVLNLNRPENDGMIISMTEDASGNLYGAEYANVPPDGGCRLWKSTDGGANWASVSKTWDARHLHAVKFNPYNGWLYVVVGENSDGSQTEYQTVWRSEDGGNTWTCVVEMGPGTDTKFLPIEFIGNDVYLGQDRNGATDTDDICKITDDGTGPFTPVTVYYNPYPAAIMTAATKLNDTIIFTTSAEGYTATCQVVMSKDGITWTVLNAQTVSPTYMWINELTIHPRKGIVYGCINANYAYYIASPSTPRPPSLQLPQDTVSAEGHCKTDFGDIRFTDDDGRTLLNYWMESKTDGDNAVFWVKVADDLSSVNRTIYVYYGKSDATTTSNPGNTFLFFDDFNGDLSKWTILSGTWAIESGDLVIQPGSTVGNNYLITKNAIAVNSIAIRTEVESTQITSENPIQAHPGIIWHANTATGISQRNDQVYLRPHETAGYGNIQPAYYSGSGGIGGNGIQMHDGKQGSYYNWNTWYTLEVRIPPSGNITLYGNSSYWHNWGNQSYSNDHIGVLAHEGGKDYFDYFAVRKFVNPEPAPGTWGPEEVASYALTVNIIGNGSVNLNNTGPYNYGDVVKLTAVPATGWNFSGWNGDLVGATNPAVLTVTGAMVVNATFFIRPSIIVYAANTNVAFGSDCTVYVNVTNVQDLYSWEFQLNYNPTILSLVSDSVVPGGLNTPTQTFKSSNTAGHLWWAVATTYPTTIGKTYASHAIFQIQFHAIAAGSSNLHLYNTILVDHRANPMVHGTTDGSITVRAIDLTVTSIVIQDYGCNIYANDTLADGVTPYYVPVNVTIHNAGTMDAGAFSLKLDVRWKTGSSADGSGNLAVANLSAGASITLQFTAVFRPTHAHYYELTATVDSQNEILENNETNNVLVYCPGLGIKVTVIGDINNDTGVSILDAVNIAQAWGATPSDGWWNIRADVNHDGVVDILDATRMGLNWGSTW